MTAPLFVPIFPLPDLTFFPHTFLALHVFEARYRAMVTDCLARDKRMAVVGLRPGYEATYDGKPAVNAVGGVGRIVQWERLATGRYDILLQGECRARIDHEVPSDTLYRVVTATPLGEVGGDDPAAASLADQVRLRCAQILEAVGRASSELRESLDAVSAPGPLCDQIASAVIPRPAVRQALLEELDVRRRLERLSAALDDLHKQLTGGGA
ncbi:MAG TPA: LON peptidase substrate-binding domain-containing protein [Methylomirabilota bacterium]|nr:LON peptidase substrate-binding domain-containing protein [Methylomirabilota bacterium]